MDSRLLARIGSALENWCLIGAHALSVHGYVRQTADIDLLTTDHGALEAALWDELGLSGYEIRRGDVDDPLGGVVRFRAGDSDVDLVVGKFKWESDLISRAEVRVIDGIEVPVPRLADLIAMKVASGGYTDLQDVANLMAVHENPSLTAQVEKLIGQIGEDAMENWTKFRQLFDR